MYRIKCINVKINTIRYVPPVLVSLIATQKSCRGLGSKAKAQDAKAKKVVRIK